jgi:hypothetical protein
MNISVNYEDSDVAKALESIIKHPNKDEFVKLLTPVICQSSTGCSYFFRLLIGTELPDVIPNGSLCKINVTELGYSSNKDLIRQKFGDEDGKIIVTVKEFRGYHEYSDYIIEYSNVFADGSIKKEITYVSSKELAQIEEF